LASLVAVGDLEFSGMYFGRYEKKRDQPQQLEPEFRLHAEAADSKLILDWLRGADVAFANLETTLAETKPYYPPRPTTYRFRADSSNAEGLRKLGIDVVSLANNHVFDYGDSAFIETLKALDDAGVKHVGAGMNLEEALAPTTLNVIGQRVAFLGFATVFPATGVAAPDRPGVAAIRNKITYEFESPRLPTDLRPGYAALPKIGESPMEEDVLRMKDRIRRAKDESDLVVVSVHWGREYEDTPTEGQRKLGHDMIDAGADIVIGHHPHTAQAIEIYNGRHIFYSLGNFAMQVEWDIARCEMFLNEAFMVKAEIEDRKISRVEILPTRTDKTGLPMITEDSPNVIKHLKDISSPLNALIVQNGRGAVVKPKKSSHK
jgi:poly-gamma-glutamate capsule biosynthesis protein CapA/YwtB (metallophosphatase superfamily)